MLLRKANIADVVSEGSRPSFPETETQQLTDVMHTSRFGATPEEPQVPQPQQIAADTFTKEKQEHREVGAHCALTRLFAGHAQRKKLQDDQPTGTSGMSTGASVWSPMECGPKVRQGRPERCISGSVPN